MKNYKFFLRGQGKSGPVIVFQLFDSRFKGRKFMYSTGHFCQEKDWNKVKQRPRSDERLSAHLDFIVRITEDYLKDRFSSRALSREDLKAYILSQLKDERRPVVKLPDFADTWETLIKTTKTKSGKPIKKGTLIQKGQTLKTLQQYAKDRKVTLAFQTLTIQFYHDFDSWMIENEMSGNTRGKHMKEIKAVLREAVERDIPVCLDFQKKSWRVIREKTDSVYLTFPELQKIFERDLPEIYTGLRDIFIAACFVGARHSDWHQIRKENLVTENGKEILRYKQTKTGEIVHVPVHPIVKLILNKYPVMPKVISNQKFNDALKIICTGSGTYNLNGQQVKKCTLVTTHTARRSFATNAYLSKSMDVHQIMRCTGHKTEASFLAYLKLDGRDYAAMAAESKFFTESWPIMKVS